MKIVNINVVHKSYDRYGRTKIFFHHVGETIMENLVNRRSRPRDEYRKMLPEVYRAIAPELSEIRSFGGTPKASWSQKCGCSMCPCSPGFNLNVEGDFYVQVDVAADDYVAPEQQLAEAIEHQIKESVK